jgi:hypothetical protein
MDDPRDSRHDEPDRRQQSARAGLFLSLRDLTADVGVKDFADCLADVAILNSRHASLDDKERERWRRLAGALQSFLDLTSIEIY